MDLMILGGSRTQYDGSLKKLICYTTSIKILICYATVDRAVRPEAVLNIDQLTDRPSDETVWIREPPTGTYRRLLPVIDLIRSQRKQLLVD